MSKLIEQLESLYGVYPDIEELAQPLIEFIQVNEVMGPEDVYEWALENLEGICDILYENHELVGGPLVSFKKDPVDLAAEWVYEIEFRGDTREEAEHHIARLETHIYDGWLKSSIGDEVRRRLGESTDLLRFDIGLEMPDDDFANIKEGDVILTLRFQVY